MSEAIHWTNETRRLVDLHEWEDNPRLLMEHDANELDKSLARFGLADPLVINLDNTIIGGHQRRRRLIELYGINAEVDCRVPSRPLTNAEMRELAIRLNRNQGRWDMDMLADRFEVGELLDFGFEQKELGFDIGGGFQQPEDESETEEENEPDILRVPDAVWGTDNDYGIPLLDLTMQAKCLEAPFAGWGTMPRKNRMTGTYHFYVEDYRFENLWKNPLDVANSACASIVEPNFSVYDDMPKAVAIWQMYRKRWLARWYQSVGITIFVDLNISERHADLRLLGVPDGWKAYCTRAYSDRLDATEREYQAAVEKAGSESILFVVYGGGKKAEELSKQRGWIWYQDQQSKDAGGKKNG